MKIAGFELERERILEIAVAVPGVLLFIGVIVYVGMEYNDGTLSSDGALALVGVIAAFIVVMSIVGIGLAYLKNPANGEHASESDSERETELESAE